MKRVCVTPMVTFPRYESQAGPPGARSHARSFVRLPPCGHRRSASEKVLPSALLLGDAHRKHACCPSSPAIDTPESRAGHGPSSISVPDQEFWQTVNMSIWGKRHGSVVPLRNPNNDEVYWVSRASRAWWDFVTDRMCQSFCPLIACTADSSALLQGKVSGVPRSVCRLPGILM